MIQEVFGFHKVENLSWCDFIEGDENHDAISYLVRWPLWSSNGVILHGNAGVGKTHIANLWAQTANAVFVLKHSIDSDPRALFSGNQFNFVIDNFDEFLHPEIYDWIFHFFNIAMEKNRFYLLISNRHPSLWNIGLEDLRSRLFTLHSINIRNPEEKMLLKIARKISNDFGIVIQDDVLCYLMNFINRDVVSIMNTLKILDKLALQNQKSITIPFIRNYLRSNFD